MDILHRIEKFVDFCIAKIPRAKPIVSKDKEIYLVAHRGAHDNTLQENTPAAFKNALDLRCYGIEFDIHATADNILVVNHDPTLKRLWNHDVAINDKTFDELKKLTPNLPSLAEIVANFGKKMHLFVEVKTPFSAVKELKETLKSLTPVKDYHIICLDETIFEYLCDFPKEAFLVIPIHNNVNKLCNLSLKKQYGGLLGHYFLLSNHQINKLKLNNQLVGIGFVDSKYGLYRELNRGLNLLFTNNAASVAYYIDKLKSK